jgi:uncharacterized protein YdaU (DUF1376 family)
MTNAPAFQLYAADFYIDTASWTIEEVGIYTRLLFYQWVNGSIPMDEKRLARIAGCTPKSFKKWWCQIKLKFSERDELSLINLRLEKSRIKQEGFHNARKKGGIVTARKRWGEKKEDSSANSSANSSGVGLHSSSSSSCTNVHIEESSYDNSSCSEPAISEDIFITIPLNDKSEYPVHAAMIDEWRNLYPKVDIEQGLRNIRGWNLSHPKERKTKQGILKHITGWLSREQDKGGSDGRGIRKHDFGTGPGKAFGTAGLAKSDDQPWPVDATY